MRFRRGTCGLCKPTKRYKTNATRRSQARKEEVLEGVPIDVKPLVNLREVNK